jgi:predicted nucleic acid-binding protein
LIAVDTNLFVYVHRSDSEWHGPAAVRVRELAEGRSVGRCPERIVTNPLAR